MYPDDETPQGSDTTPKAQSGRGASPRPKVQLDGDQQKRPLEELDRGTPFGNYTLLQKIGAGGMGQVWKARESYPRRIVALKLIKPQLFVHKSAEERSRTVRRFRTEIETAAQLEHPNIVPLYHAGEEEGRLYYTMQYVEGRNPLHVLQGYRQTVAQDDTPDDELSTSRDTQMKRVAAESGAKRPAIPRAAADDRAQWERAARYVAQASRGLSYAHNRGFIHRDIKPDNIIIDQTTDTALITDFGLAKALQESTGHEIPADYRAGTRGYMAPEQESRAGTATVQSDIFGLGATLLALLTGAPPKRVAEESDRFGDICMMPTAKIHPDLQAICVKCLQREPAKRYAASSELAGDLQRFLDVRPVSVRPVGRLERFRYWARRNPALAVVGLATVVLALAVVIGGPAASLFYLSAKHSAEIERQNKRFEAAEKRRAQEEARRTQANLHYQEARAARMRGDWLTVVECLKQARDSGYDDPTLLAIEQARAGRALGDVPAWIEEVKQLGSETRIGSHRGTILLMQGDVARFQGLAERSVELTQQALDTSLPPIDELYARAILAETTPECLDLLRDAVARNPYHYDATAMLVAALVLSGHGQEARRRAQLAESLFPDDAGFAIWLAVLAAAESNTEEMEKQIERVGDRLDEETKELVVRALRSAKSFCDTFNHMDLSRQNDLKMMWNLAMVARAIRKIHGQAGKVDPCLSSASNSLPRAYREAYAPLFELSPTNVVALLFRSSSYIDRLEEAVKRHPEGTLHMLRGSLLSAADRWTEAEQAFAAAADAPAVIPGVNLEAPMLAAAAANIAYWQFGKDPACLERAVGYVRRRVRSGPSPAFQADMLLGIANTAGDDGLAQTIIWQVLDHYDDDVGWLLTAAANELLHDKLDSALRALDQVLTLEPANAKAKAMKARVVELKSDRDMP